jgi:hypothetical protein
MSLDDVNESIDQELTNNKSKDKINSQPERGHTRPCSGSKSFIVIGPKISNYIDQI